VLAWWLVVVRWWAAQRCRDSWQWCSPSGRGSSGRLRRVRRHPPPAVPPRWARCRPRCRRPTTGSSCAGWSPPPTAPAGSCAPARSTRSSPSPRTSWKAAAPLTRWRRARRGSREWRSTASRSGGSGRSSTTGAPCSPQGGTRTPTAQRRSWRSRPGRWSRCRRTERSSPSSTVSSRPSGSRSGTPGSGPAAWRRCRRTSRSRERRPRLPTPAAGPRTAVPAEGRESPVQVRQLPTAPPVCLLRGARPRGSRRRPRGRGRVDGPPARSVTATRRCFRALDAVTVHGEGARLMALPRQDLLSSWATPERRCEGTVRGALVCPQRTIPAGAARPASPRTWQRQPPP